MAEVRDWKKLLSEWNAKLAPEWSRLIDQSIDWGLEIEPSARSVVRPACSSTDILELEQRLGKPLPRSFVNFLHVSNGAYLLERPFELLSVDRIDWLINVEPHVVKMWESEKYDAPDSLYYLYGEEQDSVHMRSCYVRDCLLVSNEFDGDSFLLNPCVINDKGEWKAWVLGNKNPGAIRYRSFWELMKSRVTMVDHYLQ